MTEHTSSGITSEVSVQVDDIFLPGILTVPDDFRCTVIFAHGSGSSRFSARNRQVSETFNRAGIATMVFDLLTENETAFQRNVFDMELLSERVVHAINWVAGNLKENGKAIGLFGSSTGAAAALIAATESSVPVGAVVSRGGRVDLAYDILHLVKSPTLLLIGSRDTEVLSMNEKAYAKLTCRKKIEVIKNASHLFEEEGALEQVAEQAKNWFVEHLWVR